jgi:hypothetical protein
MVIETPPRISPRMRWLTALGLAYMPLLAIYLVYAVWLRRLPDPLPTHWNSRGQVDGTTALAAFFAIMMAAAAAGALLATVGAVGARLGWLARRILVTVGAGVGAFVAGLWLTIAALARDHADPPPTSPALSMVAAPSWHIPVLLVGTALWTALAFVACGPAPAHPPAAGRPATALPRVDLPAGQRAAWSEISYPGPVAYLLLALLAAMAAVLTAWIDPWAATPVVLSAVVTFLLFITRLVVDRRGLRIGFGPWGWPRITVPLREIESAAVTTVRPSEWGGWGYRVRPGGRALVLRRGPGVRLELSGSRRFVASTRDPDTVAGLVNTLLDHDLC